MELFKPAAEAKVIDSFKDEYAFLSNFSPHPFVVNGYTWPTVEHYYQASKTNAQWGIDAIYQAPTPGKAKRLGSKVILRPDWEQIKVQVMEFAVYNKFYQNVIIASAIVKTGNAILIEGNYWHDNFWGNCSCKRCANKRGLNRLGCILMEIRWRLNKH